ncbi:MFS transporter [Actinomadura nitritigenes]|uniref:MFS transporter n=1 Tax=Actinomadura nitritigenes TaxID=134602 RepID=UPI003D8D22E2
MSSTDVGGATPGRPAVRVAAAAPARRAVAGSFVGSMIEWYDFFIFGTAASLVFGPQFFPSASPVASTLAAFATFAVGFVARPVGGVLMGHFGDRIGRKSMLVLSLGMMGSATVAMGVLPNYASIGVWAPVLLVTLRFLQGFGVGGEWGGAVLMATEHAPRGRAGLYGVAPQLGVPAGVLLANLAFLLITNVVPDGDFQQWGWRIPFLLSATLIALAMWIRLGVLETPEFEDAKKDGDVVPAPLLEVVRTHWRSVLLAGGTFIGANGIGIVWLTFVLKYGPDELGFTRGTMLAMVVAACPVWMLGMAVSAYYSDLVSRRGVYLLASALLLVVSLLFFPVLDAASVPLAVAATLVLAFTLGAAAGPQSALFAELFPANVRYSGASLAYQLGAILGGGIAPFIATALFSHYGTSWAITVYFLVVALISLVSIALLRGGPQVPALRVRRAG